MSTKYFKKTVLYKHPISDEEKEMTVQSGVTDEQTKGLAGWGINTNEMLVNAVTNELRQQIEENTYNDILNYCKNSDDHYKIIEVSNSEYVVFDIMKHIHKIACEFDKDIKIIASVGMCNILRYCVNYKETEDINREKLTFEHSCMEISLATNKDEFDDKRITVSVYCRPLLKYDNCELMIVDCEDYKKSIVLDYQFDDRNAVEQTLCLNLHKYC